MWLLKLKGVDSPEAADMLKGLRLLMHLRDRPALDSEDDVYVQDLVGMQVSSNLHIGWSGSTSGLAQVHLHCTKRIMLLQVVMQASGSLVGTVVDVYDGTGVLHMRHTLPDIPSAVISIPPAWRFHADSPAA